jgi:hypothetical protein
MAERKNQYLFELRTIEQTNVEVRTEDKLDGADLQSVPLYVRITTKERHGLQIRASGYTEVH